MCFWLQLPLHLAVLLLCASPQLGGLKPRAPASPPEDMAAKAISMLEYYTRDQEARHSLRGPWFPRLSSSAEPVSFKLVAISQHDTSRHDTPPVSMNLQYVTMNGTRVEYLVQLVAMTIVEEWTAGSEPALNPDLVRTSRSVGHESLEPWSQACLQNHKLVYGRERTRGISRYEREEPPMTLTAPPEPTYTVNPMGGVQYETWSDLTAEDEDDGTLLCVQHIPMIGQRLAVNTTSFDTFVATHFMSNGVPTTYNLRITGSYFPMRHKVEFEAELRRLHWYHSYPVRWPAGVPMTPALMPGRPSSGSATPFDA